MHFATMAALVALALSLTVGCGDNDQSTCGPQTVIDSRSVAPGTFVEGELDMQLGASVSVSFTSDGPLAYDLHIHTGDRVETLADGLASADSYEVTAMTAGMHYPLWSNATDQVIELAVELTIDARTCWHGWL